MAGLRGGEERERESYHLSQLGLVFSFHYIKSDPQENPLHGFFNRTNPNTNFQDIFSLFQGNPSWLESPCIYFPSAQFLKLWWYIFVLKGIFVLKMHCVKMFLFKRDWFILSKFWDSKWFVWCFFNWNHKENKICGSGTH